MIRTNLRIMEKENLIPEPGKKYMRRAMQLARYGAGFVSPNPMVGAVIVDRTGRIIGEGWHRRYGGPHAEVNAVASVRPEDEPLLTESTIYVTLEPCSHYGKTPPCSRLLIQKNFKRVVVGSPDPFPLVSGRGIKMLRDAGIEVVENFMRTECDYINRRFITAHTLHRPYILLKWAESRDGYIAARSSEDRPEQTKLSSTLSSMAMHAVRAEYDAILVGVDTVIIDNPSLTTRLWPGDNPVAVTFDSARIPQDSNILTHRHVLLDPSIDLIHNMERLYEDEKITSLMVEGGADTLARFIEAGIYDEIRVERAPILLGRGVPAPCISSNIILARQEKIEDSIISLYANSKNVFLTGK